MRSERSVLFLSIKGSFSSNMAAISQAKAFSVGVFALKSILAMRGWQGRADILRPIDVICPLLSIAPKEVSKLRAA